MRRQRNRAQSRGCRGRRARGPPGRRSIDTADLRHPRFRSLLRGDHDLGRDLPINHLGSGPRVSSVAHFFTHHGLPLLFVVIMLESFGIPLPGETALIFFGVLASKGDYSIASVIAIAATAAIVGDNLGYWVIGRVGGRALFKRTPWLKRWSDS